VVKIFLRAGWEIHWLNGNRNPRESKWIFK
jgi:hypothetical protein